jgi:hypothetical protein
MPEVKLGDKVIIKECHSMPQIVGKQGRVVAQYIPEYREKYALDVLLDEPIDLPLPAIMLGGMGNLKAEIRGPFPFRPDELELVNDKPTEIPDAFLKGFDKDDKDKG